MGSSRDGGLAAVAAAAAVQAGHVDPVQVVVVLPPPVAQGLVLAVLVTPAKATSGCEMSLSQQGELRLIGGATDGAERSGTNAEPSST